MRKSVNIKMFAVVSGMALILAGGCTTDDSFPTTNIKAVFRLKSQTAMEGRITIDEAYLKLNSVEATGNLYNGKRTDVTEAIAAEAPPFKLSAADSAEMNFTLPAGTYDHLEFNLFLFQDTYALAPMTNPPAEAPPPSQNDNPPAGGQEEGNDNTGNDNSGSDSGSDTEDNPVDEGQNDNSDNDGGGENATDGDHNDNGSGDKGHGDGKDKGKKDDHKKKKGDKKGDKGHDGRNGASQVEGAVDLDGFFRNAKPGLLVIGTYRNNGTTLRLVFAASGIGKVTIPGKQNDSPGVILATRNTAWITFDPERWFSALSPSDIEAGVTQVYQGQPVLFIHEHINPQLYEALAPQLEPSADLILDLNNF